MITILQAVKDLTFKVTVEETPFHIGRAPDNQLVIKNSTVSAYHAVLDEQEGRIVVNDLGSNLGTFVNGIRVEQAKLSGRDVLSFGPVRFRLLREKQGDND